MEFITDDYLLTYNSLQLLANLFAEITNIFTCTNLFKNPKLITAWVPCWAVILVRIEQLGLLDKGVYCLQIDS